MDGKVTVSIIQRREMNVTGNDRNQSDRNRKWSEPEGIGTGTDRNRKWSEPEITVTREMIRTGTDRNRKLL